MPNWCLTNIEIKGNNKELQELKEWMDNVSDNATYPTDFGNNWLGHFLLALGLTEDEVLSGEIRCRGELTDLELMDGVLSLQTYTAWGPCLEVFKVITDYFNYDFSFDYFSEEPGMKFYAASGKNMTDGGEYYVDCWEDKYEEFYDGEPYWSKDELYDELKKLYNSNESFKKLVERIESDKDAGVSINQIQFISFEEMIEDNAA